MRPSRRVQISITMDINILDRIDVIAKDAGTNRSRMIEKVLTDQFGIAKTEKGEELAESISQP